MKIAVVFVCYNRPQYLSRVLQRWLEIDTSNIDFYANVDYSNKHNENVILLKHFFANIKQPLNRIQENIPALGMNNNQFNASDRLFQLGYDFVIQCEDDIIPANDINHYMRSMSSQFIDDKTVMNIGAYRYIHDDGGIENQNKLIKYSFFNAWIWGTWKDRWENYFKPQWCRHKKGTWDTDIQQDYNNDKKYAIYPSASRSQNIGEFGENQDSGTSKSFLHTNVIDRIYNANNDFKL